MMKEKEEAVNAVHEKYRQMKLVSFLLYLFIFVSNNFTEREKVVERDGNDRLIVSLSEAFVSEFNE